MSQATGAGDDHVLAADGTFDVHDQPVDLKIYRCEDWIALANWRRGASVLERPELHETPEATG